MGKVLVPSERRDFSRITFHRPSLLGVRGTKTACELIDISLRGALVRVPEAFAWAEGAPCTLFISLDQGASIIRMNGAIAHRDASTVGVRCQELDLDSVAHLRRLLEVNLGDERLLHRELSALISRRRG
jgi:PilZ domain